MCPVLGPNYITVDAMNAVEIEESVSELAEQPFDAAEFPYAFLMALGNSYCEFIGKTKRH